MSDRAPTLLDGYEPYPGTYDELLDADADAGPRIRDPFVEPLGPMARQPVASMQRRAELAHVSLRNQGVTFSVYSDNAGTEKVLPFCPIPRLISAADWARLEAGLVQRVRALEAFLADVYGEQKLFSETDVPREVVLQAGYLEAVHGIAPPGGVRIHVAGIDVIRDPDGTWCVLEDNLRCPSGVSYVLQNRAVTKRVFPKMWGRARLRSVDTYPSRLAAALRAVGPGADGDCTSVVLTPGQFNSAYFEHAFLARTMGINLVEAADLFVDDDHVFARTTAGPRRVHAIYRRTDEAYLDPEVFRPDSMLGVPGIMRAYAKGNVALANAPGNGVADDKGVYPFVPDFIRYYLGEEPKLAQVETYVCAKPDERAYVLEHLDELVVKRVDGAGGYGMLMGPQAAQAERDEFARKIKDDPGGFIAQPLISLSTTPTWVPDKGRVEPRRIDLRPYIVSSPGGSWVLAGGLTRVALVEGSFVVNSSQGGGSKDTWVLEGKG